MDKVRYVNTRGETINLVKAPLITNTKQFREFIYEIENGRVKASGEKVFSVPAALVGNSKTRDKTIDALAYDSEVNKQGKLYVNDWFIYCNFAGINSVVVETDTAARLDLSFKAPKAEWLREVAYKLTPQSGEALSGLNLPFNPPFNYSAQKRTVSKIANTTVSEADFILEFNGKADAVKFSVDDTVYTVSSVMGEGEYFYLNTYTREVFKFRDNLTVDLFPVTGDDTYIFTKIPTGEHTVSWEGNFPIKLTLLERRRFPRWI